MKVCEQDNIKQSDGWGKEPVHASVSLSELDKEIYI